MKTAPDTQPLYRRLASTLWSALDTFATGMIYADRSENLKQKKKQGHAKPVRLMGEEQEIRALIKSASSIDDIWLFLKKRLLNGSLPEMISFSIINEKQASIEVRYLYPSTEESAYEPIRIGLREKKNHLVQAYQRKDTTFSASTSDLGRELASYLPDTDEKSLNIFSVPLFAANKPIAILTLGVEEIDTFSQAKLSYLYVLREQISLLIWNLLLQEQMQSLTQMDHLTGLFTRNYFQKLLSHKGSSKHSNLPQTVMLLDVNNLQQINHSKGYHIGDEVILRLASVVRRKVSGLATVARYGADEVAVLLPEMTEGDALAIAQRCMEEFQQTASPSIRGLTLSIGVADTSLQGIPLLQRAEQALHIAKFHSSQSKKSEVLSYQEIATLGEKAVLESVVHEITRKYAADGPSVFQELIQRIEHAESQELSTSPEAGKPLQHTLMIETLSSLAGALDAKDKYTCGHSHAVSNYATTLARGIGLPEEEVEQVRIAALLHDIGKIGIPESILCKPGPLDDEEWVIMNQHPIIGARQILAPIQALKDVIPMVEFHHENWDGSGHPSQLQGHSIPVGARIVSIVDAFHALTSDRSYRKALPLDEAVCILQEGAGSKWDPTLIQQFVALILGQSTQEAVALTELEANSQRALA